jgi:hypothetical protein
VLPARLSHGCRGCARWCLVALCQPLLLLVVAWLLQAAAGGV